ncbi:Inner membrane protein YbhL [Olavius algarvensis associated proteobacterium Delta 3]|nr:Inner membrane protein YbhL [Olavius algarvensis associated proteobacterium Delta 3]CAB5156923.1 Inner membrane protein YbhL [Olavius algarvensis associated proteobacterium Delta 3]
MNSQPIQQTQTQTQVLVNGYMRSVYNWMLIGLAMTGGVAWFVSQNDAIMATVQQGFWILAIGLIGLVFYLSARISRMSASRATVLFMVYASLNGAMLSFIFKVYTTAHISTTFFVCAAMFGALSVYGWVTKRDLTGVGSFMFMGLIGIIIASVVNIFLRNPAMQMIISYIGVLVFAGLTAYDTQKLKHMALTQPAGLDGAVVRKGAIIGALTLYLDFILMFQYLLMILGGQRD